MPTRTELAAAARLDFAEVLRSRWLVFSIGLYSLLGALFVFVALRESNVIGFTGMGRVLLSFCHALLLLLPLLALTAAGQVINGARADGSLELLFSHPISRAGYFLAVTLVRYGVLVIPLAALVLVLGLYGRIAMGQAIPWGFVGRTILISATLLWAFTGIGILISTAVRNQAKAVIYQLVVWAASVALLDFALIALLLQWRVSDQGVFVLAALNPVQAARAALLSAAEPELSVLGPVGFFLANRIGAGALLAIGAIWPLIVGCLAWITAFNKFSRGDVV